MRTIIKNALVINEGNKAKKNILILDQLISKISDFAIEERPSDLIIDAEGLLLLPGIIDDQVHFREPGLTHKADIYTESCAAAAGGVCSFIEMPNTNPSTTSQKLLDEKLQIAAKTSVVNYSFMLGANNENIDEIKNLDKNKVAGVKMFLGSSTGNLLVNNNDTIRDILTHSPVIVAAHCEDDKIIEKNLAEFKEKFGEDIPMRFHPEIRSSDACYKSSSNVVEIARNTKGRLHIFHLSTEKELALLSNLPLSQKRITAEVCVHHLWFNDTHYDELGTKIKWNPSIKKETDRLALIQALKDGKIDVVATDHAPHNIDEKNNVYTKAPSGGPLVQHSLQLMFELASQNYFDAIDIVKWMCHNPATLFNIEKRGFIRENYFADIVLIDPSLAHTVEKENIFYKCAWSPLEGVKLKTSIVKTIVNGQIVFDNGQIVNKNAAMQINFNN